MAIRSRNHTGLRRARRTQRAKIRQHVSRHNEASIQWRCYLLIARMYAEQRKPVQVRGYGRCTVTGRSRKMTAGNVLYEVSGFGRLWVTRDRMIASKFVIGSEWEAA